MSADPHRPPRLAERLLSGVLPPGARGAAIIGDLHEDFARRAARSPLRARLWYGREAVALALRFGWRRARGARPWGGGAPLAGIADGVARNLRYATRRLVRSPGFTLVAVLSLGLGIGANTTMFSLVNAAILRDVPYDEPDRLVDVYQRSEGFSHGALSYPDFEDVRDGTGDVFVGVEGSQLVFLQTDAGDRLEPLAGEAVTGGYFGLLGVRAAVGRLLGDEDHVDRGAHPVTVLGHGYWLRRFGGDPGAIGSELRLGGRPHTVVGVVAEDFVGSLRGIIPDAYVPIMMYDELQGLGGNTLEARGNQGFFAKARLAPGATLVEAEAVLERLSAANREEHPTYWQANEAFVLTPTADVIMNPMVDRVLVPAAGTIMAVVGLVLLLACANLASFLLARSADRRREIAVRLAMGARRRTLVGQLLTETVLLSALGGALGVALAFQALGALTAMDLPLPLPIALDLSLDRSVLLFGVGVSLGAGLLFGLAPALQGTRPELATTLRDESTGTGGARSARLRDALVAGQVTVSVVLLVAAGLFLRSMDASRRVDAGFGAEPTALVQLAPQAGRYSEAEALAWMDAYMERVRALPGVASVGLIDNLHLNVLNTQYVRIRVPGVDPPRGLDFHTVDHARVDSGLLDAVGIALLSGRSIQPSDDADAERVVLVSEAFVRRFFPDGDAVGRTLLLNDAEARVIGVTRDTKVRQLGESPRPFVYQSHRQSFSRYVTVVARTDGDVSATALGLLAEARALDPQILVVEATTMERHLATLLLPRRVGAVVIAGFAALALVLASVGLYGVVSYAVARRAREVGIRLSLGADAGAVTWRLTAGGLRLVAMGGAVGLLAAALGARLLSRLLYGVGWLDPATFVGVPVVLAAVAFVAAWIPARRVTRIDPVRALRAE